MKNAAGSDMRTQTIAILSFGTRGDVQPFITLAQGLLAAGYTVSLGADREFESLITGHNVPYAPLTLNLKQFLSLEEGQIAMQTGKVSKHAQQAIFETRVRPMLDDCWKAAQGADLLIHDTMLMSAAYHIAEKLGIGSIMSSVMPNMSPTAEFPLIGAPSIVLGRFGNKLSYQFYRLAWLKGYADLKKWCQSTLHTTPRSRFINYRYRQGRPVPVLYSYSQLVLPSPKDWNQETLASGYWFLKSDSQGQMPETLERFLANGAPPVYVGFGSMIGSDPKRLADLVVAALQKTGERGILCTGWGGIADRPLPESIFCLNEAPHDLLFPRVKAVVHHGGAGTTAIGLKCGKPTVICPFVTDQFFWGDIIAARGFGPPPIPQKKLTVDHLAAAIHQVTTDTTMRRRVETLGKALDAEEGVEQAVAFIERQIMRTY